MRPRSLPESAYVVSLLLLFVSFSACSNADRARGTAGEYSTEARSREGKQEQVVELDPGTQATLHLQVQALSAVTVPPEVKGYGRVLDPAPLSATFADLALAQATLTASEKEYQRLETLASTDNASARALEAARAATERDRVLVQSTRERIALSWGQALVNRSDLKGLVRSLAALEQLVVRIDLPAGQSLAQNPAAARLVPLSDEGDPAAGELLGQAPTTDPQMQGQGFLFLLDARSFHLAPGSALAGYLELRGKPLRGVVVPGRAIVRHQEEAWVYVQQSRSTFVRRRIALQRPLDNGWLVTGGLGAGDRVVVDGAQLLLSQELKSQIQIGD